MFWIQITKHAWMHCKSLKIEKIRRYICDQSSKDVSKCAVDHLNESRKLHIFVDENDGQTSVTSWLGQPVRTQSRPRGAAERVPWGHWLEQLQNTKINTTVREHFKQNTFMIPHAPLCGPCDKRISQFVYETQLALLLQLLQHSYYREATWPSWRFKSPVLQLVQVMA